MCFHCLQLELVASGLMALASLFSDADMADEKCGVCALPSNYERFNIDEVIAGARLLPAGGLLLVCPTRPAPVTMRGELLGPQGAGAGAGAGAGLKGAG